MTHAALTPLAGPEFDDFLYSEIGIDQKGAGLSVLTALAQSNLDPWEEAVKLARMPTEAAAAQMAAIVANLPNAIRAGPAGTIADRIVARLPNGPASVERATPAPSGAINRTHLRVGATLSLCAMALYIAFCFATGFSLRPNSGVDAAGPASAVHVETAPQ